MLSLILSAFIAQNQETEEPVQAPQRVPDAEVIEIIGITPKPDVTIFVTMVEPKVDDELQLQASFVEKIPQSLD